jgi:hypothetical protein
METIPLTPIERPAFFDGQRLTAEDLAEALAHERSLRWLHNRGLHGWGIAAGYAATGKRGAKTVAVGPGYALDCAGRDIVMEEAREAPVPPVAGPQAWHLAVAYAADEDLSAVTRNGSCGTSGAVRLLDAPLLRWLDATGKGETQVRPGLDLIVATANVEGCKLAQDVSLAHRTPLPRPQPYVFAGQTAQAETPWRAWTEDGYLMGLETTVSTAAAGFRSTPSYQARLAGSRVLGDIAYDGYAHIAQPSATSFEFRVATPFGEGLRVEDTYGTELRFNEELDIDILRGDLYWHVVWMGVEAW